MNSLGSTIGIAALTLVPGQMGGSERYFRSLTRAFSDAGATRLQVLLPPPAAGIDTCLAQSIVSDYRSSTTPRGRLLAMMRASFPGSGVVRQIRDARVEALHYPFSTMVPPMRGLPSAVTIHDVQHLEHPEFFSRTERAYRALAYAESARHSDVVITISNHAANMIHERLGISRDRIVPIYLGVDTETFRPDGPSADGNFLLYPANRWPHKNHERLFEAYRGIREAHPDLELVLTGSGSSHSTDPDGVRSLGRVSDGELASLYRGARALVFPSLYEGFGLPPLEAMASGCPVACSNRASLPEVCGDAARMFSPEDVDAIAQAILDVMSAADDWREKGLARASKFTWLECAEHHLGVYSRLLGDHAQPLVSKPLATR